MPIYITNIPFIVYIIYNLCIFYIPMHIVYVIYILKYISVIYIHLYIIHICHAYVPM